MTRRLALSITMMLAFAGSAFSQGKFDVYGGYTYQRTGDAGMNGFTGAVSGNVNSWLGFTGELTRHSKGVTVSDGQDVLGDVNVSILGFRFGPRFMKQHNDSVSTFAHVLAGGYRMSANVESVLGGETIDVSASTTGFSTAVGGGLDLRVSPRIAIRPAQLDWIYLGSMSIAGEGFGGSNGFRYSGGIVLRF